jgi:hypothetical protein
MIYVLEVKVYEHFLSPALFVKFYLGVCHSQKKTSLADSVLST